MGRAGLNHAVVWVSWGETSPKMHFSIFFCLSLTALKFHTWQRRLKVLQLITWASSLFSTICACGELFPRRLQEGRLAPSMGQVSPGHGAGITGVMGQVAPVNRLNGSP